MGSPVGRQVFVAAGLELVQDEAAQLVMQKCGIPALGIADLFACFPHFETLGIVKPESWLREILKEWIEEWIGNLGLISLWEILEEWMKNG